MGILRLCYGVHYDIATWRSVFNAPKKDSSSKTCGFCLRKNAWDNNFCGMCGTDITDVGIDLTPAEMADITIRESGPPLPLQVMADDKRIYVCQVMDEDRQLVDFKRPMDAFPWKKIRIMLEGYVAALGFPPTPVRIFAFDEAKKD